MPLGTEVDLGPGHIVLDRDPAPPPERGTAARSFRSISIVAKRSPISARPTAGRALVKICQRADRHTDTFITIIPISGSYHFYTSNT